MAKVGILVPSFGGGGLERSLLIVAANWPQPTRPLVIFCSDTGPCRREETADFACLNVAPSPRTFLSFVARLHKLLRVRCIDVLVIAGFGVNHYVLLGRKIGLYRRVRIIVSEQNALGVKLRHKANAVALRSPRAGIWSAKIALRFFAWLTQWLYLSADAIIGVSEGVARDVEHQLKLKRGSVSTIYNPIALDHIAAMQQIVKPPAEFPVFLQLPRPIVVSMGRLAPQKAHVDLIAAFADLSPSARGSLVIFGEGPLRSFLEAYAQERGISNRLFMPGFVENPWWFLARSDVFAFSSHWEGFGLALVEALACGVPVVSTDCPFGPAEILTGVPGTQLVPVGDTEKLKDSIEAILATGEKPIVDLTPYSAPYIAKQYWDLANALVEFPLLGDT